MLKFIATYPLTCIASTTLAILVSVIFPVPEGPPAVTQRATIVDLWAPPLPPPVPEPVKPVPPPLPVTTVVLVDLPKPKLKSEVPQWVLKGIAKVETRSEIKEDGSIIWKDRRVGKNGDSGVFQMTRIAYKQVSKPGDNFLRLRKDPDYAKELAERYLGYLRKRYTRWHDVIAAYNAGTPGHPAGRRYLKKVLAAAS